MTVQVDPPVRASAQPLRQLPQKLRECRRAPGIAEARPGLVATRRHRIPSSRTLHAQQTHTLDRNVNYEDVTLFYSGVWTVRWIDPATGLDLVRTEVTFGAAGMELELPAGSDHRILHLEKAND